MGRMRPLPAANANFLWANDFVFDATAKGVKIKCLTVVDEVARECSVSTWPVRSAPSG
jgi:putative transposase